MITATRDEAGGRGDGETGRRGDAGTGGRGEVETRGSGEPDDLRLIRSFVFVVISNLPCRRFAVSPRLRVSASPRFPIRPYAP
jgi:hypothetical protein